MSDIAVVVQLVDGALETVILEEDTAFAEVDDNNNLHLGDDIDGGTSYLWNSNCWTGFEAISLEEHDSKYDTL